MFVGKDTAVEAKKGIKVGVKSLQRSPFALDADAVVVASGGPSTSRVRVFTTTSIDIFFRTLVQDLSRNMAAEALDNCPERARVLLSLRIKQQAHEDQVSHVPGAGFSVCVACVGGAQSQ